VSCAVIAPEQLEGSCRQRLRKRLAPAAAALLINLALFGLMPYLLTRDGGEAKNQDLATPVNVIRLKQPESPLKRTPEKPPEPPPPKKTVKPPQAKAVPTTLSLPFAINPRLPSSPSTLNLPVMPPGRIGVPTDIVGDGDLDAPLTVMVRVPPVYPLGAKNRGTEGWVKVRFIVNEDGTVQEVAVVDSEPQKTFDDAVIRAVSGWRFKAGTVGGVPVKCRAETVVRFKLD
jgi:protein TonB